MSAAPLLSGDPFALADNTWRQLTLADSTRYVTPGFRLSPEPVQDPNPRTRSYSGLVGGANRLFYFGGAHGSYPGNDVEVFDPDSMRWEQSYQPEVCPYVSSAPCYDIYNGWGTMLATPLGRPYVEHTYQIYAYDPSHNRLLATLNNGTWAYDLASRRWTALAGPIAGTAFSPRGQGPGNRHLFGFDQGLGAFQAVVTSGATRGTYRFDDRTRQWNKRGAPPETGWTTLYSTYAADRGVHFVYAPGWSKRWWRYEATPDRWTPLAPPPAIPDSFDYDTVTRVVVAVSHPARNSLRVMVYDPATDHWSDLPSAAGPVPAMTSGLNAAPMAWRYLPSRNVFVFLEGDRGTSAGGPTRTWIYRYRNDAGDRTPPDRREPDGPPPADTADARARMKPPPVVAAQADKAGTSDMPRSFAERCADPRVVRCFGFDSDADVAGYVNAGDSRPTVDTSMRASGAGSLKMTIPSRSGPNTSGYFAMNFTPGSLNQLHTDGDPDKGPGYYPAQFGEGEEFYVQWRQRFTPEFLSTRYSGGGWKQVIVGEGDRTGHKATSCTQLELVVNNGSYRGFPRMYHSCGGKDGQYQGLYEQITHPGKTTPDIRIQNMIAGCVYGNERVPPCLGYKPDQWMTFQMHVKIGTWYKNDRNYHRDSLVELWVAEENQPARLVVRMAGYDLANQNPAAKYGKVWLTPYDTGRDRNADSPETYTWYDDLIVSRGRIPD